MIEQNVAVWVDEARCKACNICVSYCPSGTLAMREDQNEQRRKKQVSP